MARGRLATLAGAPRCCPPLAAAPLEPAASPVDPAVRTTAATASGLAAAATALPLAAERCLASLSPRYAPILVLVAPRITPDLEIR